MGLFFNYDKEGPGVDKNAPKKRGIFLYTELFFRKFWMLIKANMLYFVVSLPVMAVYNFIIINTLSTFLPQNAQSDIWQLSLILTALLAILWGTGPVTAGYTFILRNFAREEHVWIFSDFFAKARECFLLGITVFICDLVILVFGVNAVNVYLAMIKSGMGIARYALGILFVLFFIYTFMHFYVYEYGVTFENKIPKTIKNALITAVATLPANLFLTLFVAFATFMAFYYLTPFAIIVLLFFVWMSFMRFPIDFYAARMIKRRFIDPKNDRESGE